MQEVINSKYFDWSRENKPVIKKRGMAAILNDDRDWSKTETICSSRCVWGSSKDNVNSRYLSRKLWS